MSWGSQKPQQVVTFLSLSRTISYSFSIFKEVWERVFSAPLASILEIGNEVFEKECWIGQLTVLNVWMKARIGHRWNGYIEGHLLLMVWLMIFFYDGAKTTCIQKKLYLKFWMLIFSPASDKQYNSRLWGQAVAVSCNPQSVMGSPG